MRLRLVGENPDAAARSLQSCQTVRLAGPEGAARDLTLSSLRRQTQPKGAWLAHFKEVKDRNGAEGLVGWSVYIPEAAARRCLRANITWISWSAWRWSRTPASRWAS